MFCASIPLLLLHVVNIISMRTLKSFRTMLKKFQIIFEYNLKIIAQYFVGRNKTNHVNISVRMNNSFTELILYSLRFSPSSFFQGNVFRIKEAAEGNLGEHSEPQSPKALSLMAVSMTKKDTFLYLRLNREKYECD